MNPELFEIHAELSLKCHHFCKTLSQQKHFVLQSTAPLQLKSFKVGSKMAIAEFAPVLPNQKKQCCKIARFTDAPCIFRKSTSRSSKDLFSSAVRKHIARSERRRRMRANFSSRGLICELDDRLGQYAFTLDNRLGQHVRTLEERMGHYVHWTIG